MDSAAHEDELRLLLDDLAEQHGYDFREYRRESVHRRVRAALYRTRSTSVADLRRRLQEDPALFPVVVDALTVQVSHLFRDPATYRLLRQEVVPILRTYPTLQIWIAGCSTGEEIYSVAIALAETDLLSRCRIYATDLSALALERARRGAWPAAKLPDFARAYQEAGGRRRLDRYFTVEGEEAVVAAELRQQVAFFQHDLGTDQVFGDMHLVCCRNVLIYFGADLRRRALGTLSRSLCAGGFLALGRSERLLAGEHAGMSEISRSVPLYRRAEGPLTEDRTTEPGTPHAGTPRPGRNRSAARAPRTVDLSTVPPESDERPSVLLVDDNEDNLVALEALLGDMNCDLHRASSGNEALRLLLRQRFALMLLDVQMPNMDGFEVARHARENPRTREVPIIFLTAAHHSETSLLRGYGSGAVDFLHKPLNPPVLRGKVAVFLELFQSRQRLAAAMADLDEARRAAERVSQFKSQFLANMSHELRTPLNAIIGFGELLEDDQRANLHPDQREFIGHIISSGKHLVALMNDILDLARIEAGRVDLRREQIPLQPLVETARDIVRPAAMKAGVSLESHIDPDLGTASVDPVRIKQVLYNLLSNGIKFTPKGGAVRLRASASASASAQQVTLAVEDTGIGIRPEDLGTLFKEFGRIEPVSGERREGTGLGLALTRRLVELHGGTISVASQPGKGSVFTVVLPRSQSQA